MKTIYNPDVTVSQGSDYICWSGTLSALFEDWEQGGFSCLETTGNCRHTVRRALKKNGTYRYYGGVGTYFDLTVTGEII